MPVIFSACGSVEALREQCRVDRAAASEIIAAYMRDQSGVLESCAANLLPALKTSYSVAQKHLTTSCDPNVRIAVLFLIRDYWEPQDESARLALAAAFDDSVPLVRGVGLYVLEWLRPLILDPRGELAEILRNDDENVEETEALPSGQTLKRAIEAIRQIDLSQSVRSMAAMKRCRQLADQDWEEMSKSRENAERFLEDAKSDRRLAALMLIRERWKCDKHLALMCETLVMRDRESSVRELALTFLAEYYDRTDNKRIGRMFADIVLDETRSKAERKTAYLNLFMIRGMPVESWPISSATFDWENVTFDMSFVNSFIDPE